MADDQDQPNEGIPDWQRNSDANNDTDGKPVAPEDQLAVARRFLDDEDVKTQPHEKKVAFLKAKGISDDDIETLLGHADPQPQTPSTDKQTTNDTSSLTTSSEPSAPPSTTSPPPADRAPIVTYPEFLANQQPSAAPPLVTTAGLLTTLQLTTALSTLLVGTSKLVLAPMLDRLTDSRLEYHAHATTKLDALTSLLEATVSAVPPKQPSSAGRGADDDDADGSGSEADDPTEMFHRDVGTQTVLPVPSVAADAPKLAPAEAQSARVDKLVRSLGEIKDGLRNQSDDLGDIKTLVDVFRDDLDVLTYKSPAEMAGMDSSYYGKAGARKTEAEDETRKVRDNIRRIKGVLLSTRSFPATMR